MTEMELERLIVRLTGDGSSYQRMIEQAEAGNKKLEASLKKVEEAQKQTDNQTKKLTSTFLEATPVVQAYRTQLELVGRVADSVKGQITSLKEAMVSLKNESMSVATAAAYSSGYFDERNYFQKVIAQNSPGTWKQTFAAGSAGIRRNMATVVRDESGYDPRTGAIDVYQRRITSRQAEHEAYQMSLRPEGEQRAYAEREHERSLARNERSRIDDPDKRMRAIQDNLTAIQNEENKVRASVHSTTGGGARARYERLDSDWAAKAVSTYTSAKAGVENPYAKAIEKANEELQKERETLKEIEAIRRSATREVEAEALVRKHALEDEQKASSRALEEVGMNPSEKRAARLKRMGASPEMIAEEETKHTAKNVKELTDELDLQAKTFGMTTTAARIYKMELDKVDPKVIEAYKAGAAKMVGLEGNQIMGGIRQELDEFGMSGREVRDKRAIEKMRKEGHSEETISGYRSKMEELDKLNDEKDMADNVDSLVKKLNEQADAFKNNTDVMAPYASVMAKMNEAQKAAVTTAVKNADEQHKRAVMGQRAEGIKDRFGDPRERLRKEQAELDKMLKEGVISANEYAKALDSVKQSLMGVSSASRAVTQGIDGVAGGSADAYERLMTFRENAFATRGDTRGATSKGSTRISERKMEIARRKAREQRIAMGLDGSDDAQRMGKAGSERGGASDYWSSNGKGESPITVLERIAKAVEKEAETKVETAGLK